MPNPLPAVRRVAIVGGNRIPFARSNTAYASASNQDMLSFTLQGLIDRYGLHRERLGEVVAGAAIKHSRDFNLTREALLSTTLARQTPAYDMQQACATGLEATLAVANKIALGQIDAGIAGGVDSTSDAPISINESMRKILLEANRGKSAGERVGALAKLRPAMLFEPQLPRNVEPRTGLSMGEHCELMAKRWNISRDAQDAFARDSHRKLADAYARGFYNDLMTPYRGLSRDNNLRADLTLDRLANLKPAFDRDAGTLSAGNSTPLTDGASAVLLASDAWAAERGLPVLAYLSWSESAAVDFFEQREGLLMAPAYAAPRLLARAGLTLQDFDLYEIHEAFAAQVLCTLAAWQDDEYCRTQLGTAGALGALDRARLNVNGGSLATGHPFAATGARCQLVCRVARASSRGPRRSARRAARAWSRFWNAEAERVGANALQQARCSKRIEAGALKHAVTADPPRRLTMTQSSQAPLPPAAAAADGHADAARAVDAGRAPNTDGIWYASYPVGVPHEIDLTQYESLVHFFDSCVAQFRERVAYVSVGADLTYAELGRKATALAAYLQSIGVQPGERVAIMLPNTFQFPVSLFGVLKAGAIAVNVNPLYTVRELAHQLKDCGAQTIIVFENFAKTVEDALPGTRVKNVLVTGLGDLLGNGPNLKGRLLNFMLRHVKKMVPAYRLPHAVPLVKALSMGRARSLAPVRIGHDDLALLQYTGGTTGVAKGAMLTHGNIIANLLQAKVWAERELNGEIETVLTPLPLYHIFSLTVNALIFMGLGGRNILIANPRDVKRVMMIIRREKFTSMTAVNTLYNAFLDNEEFRNRDFSNLKLAMAGGMATQKAVAERFRTVTGKPIVEGYGLTECSPIVSMNPVDLKHVREFEGSIGLPAPSTQVRFRKDDGGWANVGVPGELCVKGPQVMKGYWNRPDETARAIDADGWFATGDIGVMDSRGFIRLIDRKKDVINVSGFNVYPNEIEDVIATHPDVREVAAIGVPDAAQGERVKVFVVRRKPTLTAEQVIAHCRKNLTGYKVPKQVEFRDELPQSNVGKILRRALRDEELAKQTSA